MGVPSVVLCTTPFAPAAALQWRALGHDQPAPIVTVGHPLGSMPVEQVLTEADAAADLVAAALVQPRGDR
jgi:hypothetical protein